MKEKTLLPRKQTEQVSYSTPIHQRSSTLAVEAEAHINNI
jgi:hypothetical protein